MRARNQGELKPISLIEQIVVRVEARLLGCSGHGAAGPKDSYCNTIDRKRPLRGHRGEVRAMARGRHPAIGPAIARMGMNAFHRTTRESRGPLRQWGGCGNSFKPCVLDTWQR